VFVNTFAKSKPSVMQEIRLKLHTALLLLVVVSTTTAVRQAAVAKGGRSFTIYDNLFYRGKPNTVQEGLVGSDILYEDRSRPWGES
jgi:hypothetical protein